MKKKKLVAAAMSLILLMTGCSTLNEKEEVIDSSVSSEITTDVVPSKETAPIKAVSGPYSFEYKQIAVSDMFRDTMGEDMYEAYCNFITAIENGETSFECSDEYTCGWMMGQYADNCNPCVGEFTEMTYYEDGVGHFAYTIPEDEFRQKLADWEVLVTDIINGCGIEEGDSDFEKAILIYSYIANNYVYDHYAAEHYNDDQLSVYRLFTEGQGICQEIGMGYAYLLMQVGVDAAGSGGWREDMTTSHEWTIVNINGTYYNVDATWALGNSDLCYFLFSDAMRYQMGGYPLELTKKVNNYPYFTFDDYVSPYMCNDDSFQYVVCGTYMDIDHENNILYYLSCDEGCQMLTFDYSDYT